MLLLAYSSMLHAANVKHVELGLKAIDTIQKEKNLYGTPAKLVIQGANGSVTENRTECASFVTQLFRVSYGLNDAFFKSWSGSTSPTSAKYFDAIQAGNKFSRITKINSVQPGDLIAVKYLSGNSAGDSGHMMVVLAAPEPMTAVKPLVTGTEQYQVLVMDSTKSPHGTGDSRVGASEQGLGKGYIRLYVNAAGEMVGYAWSRSVGSTFYGPNQRPFIVGRMNLP